MSHRRSLAVAVAVVVLATVTLVGTASATMAPPDAIAAPPDATALDGDGVAGHGNETANGTADGVSRVNSNDSDVGVGAVVGVVLLALVGLYWRRRS